MESKLPHHNSIIPFAVCALCNWNIAADSSGEMGYSGKMVSSFAYSLKTKLVFLNLNFKYSEEKELIMENYIKTQHKLIREK